MRLHIARLLRVDNSYGNIPLDFSQGIEGLLVRGMDVYNILQMYLVVASQKSARVNRGLVKPTSMEMVCLTRLNPIGPNWGENALLKMAFERTTGRSVNM